MFNDASHSIVLSDDGSYTAYSKEYDEHYHSTKDGALNESLYKHIYPAFKLKSNQKELNILDICFGLGFNTLATLYFIKKHSLDIKVNIFSPELDKTLVDNLKDFNYPDKFEFLKPILLQLSKNKSYQDEKLYVEVFIGDARKYIKKFQNKFDIIYQDAFSPSTNPILWTLEYFEDIKNAIKDDGILTTYSTSLATRLALFQNDFNVYLNSGESFRNATVASLKELKEFKLVDMAHKITCNPDKKPLRD